MKGTAKELQAQESTTIVEGKEQQPQPSPPLRGKPVAVVRGRY